MSTLKSVGQIALVVATGIGLGLWARQHDTQIPSWKSVSFRAPSRAPFGKAFQSVDVKLEPVEGFPSENSSPARIRAVVRIQGELNSDLQIQWDLPEGAELISGVQQENLGRPRRGEVIEREITVQGFSSEGNPRNVTLQWSTLQGGLALGNAAVLSSHPTRSDLSIGFRDSKTGQTQERPGLRRSVAGEATEDETPLELPKGVKF